MFVPSLAGTPGRTVGWVVARPLSMWPSWTLPRLCFSGGPTSWAALASPLSSPFPASSCRLLRVGAHGVGGAWWCRMAVVPCGGCRSGRVTSLCRPVPFGASVDFDSVYLSEALYVRVGSGDASVPFGALRGCPVSFGASAGWLGQARLPLQAGLAVAVGHFRTL